MVDDTLSQANDQSTRRSTPRRRPWLLSLGLGLICAVVVGISVFLSPGDRYTATSMLKVEMQERSVMGTGIWTGRDRFEILKNTQREILLGRGVLTAALRNPAVRKIPVVMEKSKPGKDAPDWLKRHLSIDFPGKAEIMQVSVTCCNAKEAAALVNAVVDSYLTDVVSVERIEKRERLSKLESACADKDQHIRNLRSELKSLAIINGIGVDSETMTQKQKLLLEELGLYRQELARREFEVSRFENELAVQKALLRNVDTAEVPDDEVDALVQKDPMAQALLHELALRKMRLIVGENGGPSGGDSPPDADRFQKETKALQDAFDKRREQLAAVVRKQKRSALQAEIIKIETSLKVMTRQRDDLAKTVDTMRKEAQTFGCSNVDMEMLRSELKQSEFVLAKLNDEREIVRIELCNAPRIYLIEKAEPPATPSNENSRLALTAMAMLAAFCCPVVVVMFWHVCTAAPVVATCRRDAAAAILLDEGPASPAGPAQ